MMEDEVLAHVKASPGRRWLGIGTQGTLGFMLIYVALSQPPSLTWQVFLLVVGGLVLWTANKMRRATEQALELTRTELRDSSGAVLARIDDIDSVDRGFFAFKPSHGFLVRTKKTGERAWSPGLWWRMGRRIGVGGVTAGRETRFMSEMLSALLAERDGS